MDASEEYQQYADRCVALAQRTQDPADKVRLLEMARAWRELAERADNPRAPKKS